MRLPFSNVATTSNHLTLCLSMPKTKSPPIFFFVTTAYHAGSIWPSYSCYSCNYLFGSRLIKFISPPDVYSYLRYVTCHVVYIRSPCRPLVLFSYRPWHLLRRWALPCLASTASRSHMSVDIALLVFLAAIFVRTFCGDLSRCRC